jgi:hypothetical protein
MFMYYIISDNEYGGEPYGDIYEPTLFAPAPPPDPNVEF